MGLLRDLSATTAFVVEPRAFPHPPSPLSRNAPDCTQPEIPAQLWRECHSASAAMRESYTPACRDTDAMMGAAATLARVNTSRIFHSGPQRFPQRPEA